jgi:hypothetical protein
VLFAVKMMHLLGKYKEDDLSPTSSLSPVVMDLIRLDRPLTLVYCDEKGKFSMDIEVISTLQHLKVNLSVVYLYGHECQRKIFN